MERTRDGRVAPSQGEDAEVGQEVEVAPTLGVVEVAALAPHVVVVEPDGLEHPPHLRVHVLGLQAEVLTLACAQDFFQLERHRRLLVGPTRLRLQRRHRRPVPRRDGSRL